MTFHVVGVNEQFDFPTPVEDRLASKFANKATAATQAQVQAALDAAQDAQAEAHTARAEAAAATVDVQAYEPELSLLDTRIGNNTSQLEFWSEEMMNLFDAVDLVYSDVQTMQGLYGEVGNIYFELGQLQDSRTDIAAANSAAAAAELTAMQAVSIANTAVQNRGAIGSTQDLNTVTAIGLYRQATPSVATSTRNYPVNSGAGILEVAPADGSGSLLQRYTVTHGAGGADLTVHVRRYTGGVWSAWVQVATKASVDALTSRVTATENVANAALPIVSTSLSATDNLNDIVVPGQYHQFTSANATVAKNYPYTVGGVLEVLTANNHTSTSIHWRLQRYTPFAGVLGARSFAERKIVSGVAEPWRYFSDTRVDQTAGRAIYTWDNVNNREQRIYGCTGTRDIQSLLPMFDFSYSGHGAIIRRDDDAVTVEVWGRWLGVAEGDPARMLIPVGFSRSASGLASMRYQILPDTATGVSPGALLVDSGNIWFPASALVVGDIYRFRLEWTTATAWPTTLPGTAVGTIPSL